MPDHSHRRLPPPQSLVLASMARAGHHAVANWIAMQFPGPIRMLHFCDKHGRPLRRRGVKLHKNGFRNLSNAESSISQLRCTENLKPCRDGDCANECHIASADKIIIVLRDPYNWLASSLKQNRDVTLDCGDGTIIDTYGWLLEQAVGTKNYFPGVPCLGVDYNRWFASADYRRDLADTLDLRKPFTDAGINRVSHRGRASSFDGMRFQDCAQKMDVLNRWKHYQDDPEFWAMIPNWIDSLARSYFTVGMPERSR